jgi:hypothetical protein
MRTLFAFLALSAVASADQVTLKDGRVLEGEIVEENEKSVKLKLKMGAMTIDRADVQEIVRKLTPQQEYRERLAKLDTASAEQQLEIGVFARRNDMKEEALGHFLAAWELDPSSKAAATELKALDYHLVNGKWLTPDEYYPLQGYLKLDRKWYAPLEHAWRLAARETEKKEGERRLAEEAVTKAHRAISEGESRVRELTEKIVDLENEIDDARLKKVDIDAEYTEARATHKGAVNDPGHSSELANERKRAADRLARAIEKLNEADRALRKIDEKIEKAEKAIAAADEEIARVGYERENAEKNIKDLEKTVEAAEAAVRKQRAVADEAKKVWEKSR